MLGKSVVAGVVSGRVRIKGRNGNFRTLRANELIPLGRRLCDERQGAADVGRGWWEDAQCGLLPGAFKVTQTRGASR